MCLQSLLQATQEQRHQATGGTRGASQRSGSRWRLLRARNSRKLQHPLRLTQPRGLQVTVVVFNVNVQECVLDFEPGKLQCPGKLKEEIVQCRSLRLSVNNRGHPQTVTFLASGFTAQLLPYQLPKESTESSPATAATHLGTGLLYKRHPVGEAHQEEKALPPRDLKL